MKKLIFICVTVFLVAFLGYQYVETGFSDHVMAKVRKTLKVTPQNEESKKTISTAIDSKVLEEQKNKEESFLKDSAGSTLNDPYIKVNPYGNAPLSAVVIFDTEDAAKISFTVKGKEKDVNINKTIKGYSKHHQLSILGLYAGQENIVKITATSKGGKVKTKIVKIKTAKLPDAVPTISIEKIDKEKMENVENGLTFAVPSTKYAIGFDSNGDIRWYSAIYNSHVFKLLDNGHLLCLGKDTNSGEAYNRLYEMDFSGKIYQAYAISEKNPVAESEGSEKTMVHHDAIELPSGNLLLTVNDGGGKYIEDTMIELDRKTGKIVKTIDLKDILPVSFYENYNSTTREDGLIDWFHQNSIAYDEKDDSIIISGRNQDTVMKLNYKTNEIIWILSDEEGWPEEYQRYLIKGIGDNFKFPGGQHAPIILSESETDNNSETIDLLLYDNNVTVTRGDNTRSKQYSAAAQYRINEKTKTAERVWTYGAERGEALFTNIIGSARYMEDTGNRLVNFGWVKLGKESHIVEVDNQDQASVVFEAVLSDFPTGAWAYRAERLSLYPEVKSSRINSGVRAVNE
ncbi:aryl-sulfate sulfotransferase [Bacillus rubiinfantis]|uniref:aryl-sulfate sulfotransferase n=1 Tax=Bacillus rubiinfantis TaxID=1499680 RepID=UPI0005AAFA8D|nr:aryl-sulfate sulfotransferase [Bacillus rubiinfantis]